MIKLLAEAQAEMTNPPLNGLAYASKTRSYKYALLQDVEAVVKPPLIKRGIFITQSIKEDNRLHTVVYFGEEVMELDSRPVLCTGSPQDNGAAETYAKRYALCSVFCIVGEEDTDAQDVQAPQQAQQEQQAPQLSALDIAKHRLWGAIKLYAQNHGADPNAVLEGVKSRPDYAETVEFYDLVSNEFTTAG